MIRRFVDRFSFGSHVTGNASTTAAHTCQNTSCLEKLKIKKKIKNRFWVPVGFTFSDGGHRRTWADRGVHGNRRWWLQCDGRYRRGRRTVILLGAGCRPLVFTAPSSLLRLLNAWSSARRTILGVRYAGSAHLTTSRMLCTVPAALAQHACEDSECD